MSTDPSAIPRPGRAPSASACEPYRELIVEALGRGRDLRVEHLDLGPQPRVRLHGKGDKWRVCPLWSQTVDAITRLLREARSTPPPTRALFTSHGTRALTRFGLYKIVRRHTDPLRVQRAAPIGHHVGPHVFRHNTEASITVSGPRYAQSSRRPRRIFNPQVIRIIGHTSTRR